MSIIVVNFGHPEVVDVCLRTLQVTEGVAYEVVVVDNGSEPHVVEALRQHQAEGRITTLVEEPVNHFFSQGNNIGVRNSNPDSEYVLLLNSDVAFLRPDWLTKLVGWAEGTTEYRPTVWGFKPATPNPGRRDVVSIGWSHDASVEPSHCRPEGWCCLIRRTAWVDLSADFPFHYGFEEAIAHAVRCGAKIGVLWNYSTYLVHKEGGSGKAPEGSIVNARTPDIPGWFSGLRIETLDFCLGPTERDSYLQW